MFLSGYKKQALIGLLLIIVFSNHPVILSTIQSIQAIIYQNKFQEDVTQQPSMLNTLKTTMTNTLRHAKITPHRSAARGHANHGWLDTYHSFSFANWYNPKFNQFGSLRVLNEDKVKANNGFPAHPHRDFEIFSYILSGELTHTDSTHKKKDKDTPESELYCKVKRGDLQFTTAGTGVTHAEFNYGREPVHFLQIWAIPWKRGLAPRYDWGQYSDDDKRKGFVSLLSPLKGGVDATAAQEKAAEPTIPGTIAIHADFVMAAGIIAPGSKFEWTVGAKAAEATKRKVYVHLPMTKGGRAKIRLDGREDGILVEGDGAFVDSVNAGDRLVVESVGDAEAEVVILDTA
jgi:redox-sensitive bicupin YhaK (pirin superfamily)